ncbi:hypothetical protein PSMK_20690 [Phycisphaera mikurensis NBRC 102666]|uniref:DNA polymerase Y-family little finger domain-containing protein n=2 Tax=Phycisphaera TaxID=666508 RepID=I0IG40_PHYMF|nr:hypothetical protein PSMK_20690 [Phycisphaera mikurensis NBRC 102666]
MTSAQAVALLPPGVEPELIDHAPEADAAALAAIARWCQRLGPVVATDPPDGLLLDLTGCERLHGGLHRMARVTVGRLTRLGLELHAALAPTLGGAWALARFDPAPLPLVGGADEDAALAALARRLDPLPVAALRLEPAEVAALEEVGIDRVEQLRVLPREAVADRFGSGVLRRIDQADGHVREGVLAVKPWTAPRVEQAFGGPCLSTEAVSEAFEKLTRELCELLGARGRAASSITLGVDRLDADLKPQHASKPLTLSRPSRNPRHLGSLLSPHVERLDLARGVECVSLTAAVAPRRGHLQLAASGVSSAAAAADRAADLAGHTAQLVDLLCARLGREAVLQPRLVDSHVPEASFAATPAAGSAPRRPAGDPRGGRRDAAHGTPRPHVDRPTRLLDPPEPADAVYLNPDGPILTLTWRGTRLELDQSVGPEPIARRWWRDVLRKGDLEGFGPERAYHRVRDSEGRWLWVFRRSDNGSWFVHGVWA